MITATIEEVKQYAAMMRASNASSQTTEHNITDVARISKVAPYLIPVMLAIFLIFTNLILFNLMIAMFKYEYSYSQACD